MPPYIAIRSSGSTSSSTSSLSPIYIVGIAVVGACILVLALWLGIRSYRHRSRARREKQLGAAFLSIRGLVPESEKERSFPEGNTIDNAFSREQLTRSVVLPQKVLTRPSVRATRDDILDFHRQSGMFPSAFTPKPFSFALSSASARNLRPAALDADRGSWVSYSGMSSLSAHSRFSVISSTSSMDSTPTSGTMRKVRQLFNPILPDELVIRLGESLTVLQSFDDGWCVVGRDSSTPTTSPMSLFKSSNAPPVDNNVELGVAPAWCFLKPVKGLRAERPVRGSSLGITVQMESPISQSRDELISWSNF